MDRRFDLSMLPRPTTATSSWGSIGRKFVAYELWAPTAADPFVAGHLKSLKDSRQRQGADTLLRDPSDQSRSRHCAAGKFRTMFHTNLHREGES
jgi:hypothetical protein